MSNTTEMSLPLWLDKLLAFLQKLGVGLSVEALAQQWCWLDGFDL
jgi:hypothetical protein